MKRTRLRHATAFFAVFMLSSAMPFVVRPRAAFADPAPINGGGSGFAALEVDQWRADTARKPYSLRVNYVSQGSSFGRAQFIENNLDFGASDIVFLPEEINQLAVRRCSGQDVASCFVYVPVSAGGLALMFNLIDGSGSRVTDLKLTRRAACKIFTNQIRRWNDPEIVATNPQLASFDRDIRPIIRGDGAGESYVLSEFCIAVAPDVWQAFIADRVANDPSNVGSDFMNGQPVSNYPQNWGRASAALYADGVANVVADQVTGTDAITYVAAGYAKVRSFPVASLENAAGAYTQPDEDNVTVALSYATGRGDGTFILNFTGGDPRSYFPSTYSYILAQTGGFDASKGETLSRFLCYAVSKGQEIAPSLRYARLSSELVNIAIDAIVRIPGAPSKEACPVEGSAPPPPPPDVGTGSGGAVGGAASTSAGSSAGGTAAGASAANGAGATDGSVLVDENGNVIGGGAGGVARPLVTATTDSGSKSPSNGEAAWVVLQGAALCAIGSSLAGRRRRSV